MKLILKMVFCLMSVTAFAENKISFFSKSGDKVGDFTCTGEKSSVFIQDLQKMFDGYTVSEMISKPNSLLIYVDEKHEEDDSYLFSYEIFKSSLANEGIQCELKVKL